MTATAETLENPFTQDVAEPIPPPAAIVLFGGSGDLTSRKLLPAIYNLFVAGRLPEEFALVGVGRTSDTDKFRATARESVAEFSRTGFDEDAWGKLEPKLEFIDGDFGHHTVFDKVAAKLRHLDREYHARLRHFFYLAVAPRFFGTVAAALGERGLGAGSEPRSTLLIEKPFGHDLASAQELNATLKVSFDDDQILRIDHYLGKETVQNLLFFRFTNGIFEPVWNRRYVDHVQITVAEELGIGHRAGYYDRAGAIRDIIQNHVSQLVALVGMEPPTSFASDIVHAEKLKLLQAIEVPAAGEIEDRVVRGQYAAGWIAGEQVPGYREEPGVPEDSRTDTYVAMQLAIDNWRWAGVPFFVRTGKRLPVRLTEIMVAFRSVPHLPLPADSARAVVPNELVFQVQPNEGASLRLVVKAPDTAAAVRPVNMDFQYGESFLRESPEAYETLLHDALLGDAALFTSAAEVETTWGIVDPVLAAWRDSGAEPEPYEAGSQGPPAAEELIGRGGRHWRRL